MSARDINGMTTLRALMGRPKLAPAQQLFKQEEDKCISLGLLWWCCCRTLRVMREPVCVWLAPPLEAQWCGHGNTLVLCTVSACWCLRMAFGETYTAAPGRSEADNEDKAENCEVFLDEDGTQRRQKPLWTAPVDPAVVTCISGNEVLPERRKAIVVTTAEPPTRVFAARTVTMIFVRSGRGGNPPCYGGTGTAGERAILAFATRKEKEA